MSVTRRGVLLRPLRVARPSDVLDEATWPDDGQVMEFGTGSGWGRKVQVNTGVNSRNFAGIYRAAWSAKNTNVASQNMPVQLAEGVVNVLGSSSGSKGDELITAGDGTLRVGTGFGTPVYVARSESDFGDGDLFPAQVYPVAVS